MCKIDNIEIIAKLLRSESFENFTRNFVLCKDLFVLTKAVIIEPGADVHDRYWRMFDWSDGGWWWRC